MHWQFMHEGKITHTHTRRDRRRILIQTIQITCYFFSFKPCVYIVCLACVQCIRHMSPAIEPVQTCFTLKIVCNLMKLWHYGYIEYVIDREKERKKNHIWMSRSSSATKMTFIIISIHSWRYMIFFYVCFYRSRACCAQWHSNHL